MDNKYTTNDLLKIFQEVKGSSEKEVDPKKLKYVMYARKPTESEERQVRSLPDQVLDCTEFAENQELTIVGKPIQESESAKEPDIRPLFRKMIDDIKDGKYDGIVAWHPNRLARNMKEAGEIIDLLDKKIIKDLKFKSFQYTNDSSGKMLLGMAFVLSKQYSDVLSDSVSRGVRRSIEEGKYLSGFKHGYQKDKNQYLRPDGLNFQILKKAWRMRIQGETLETIADYMNKKRYEVAKWKGKKHRKLCPFTLSNEQEGSFPSI